MIIKLKEFQEAVNAILCAVGVDKNAGNLELVAKNDALYLNVTNREFYVSVKFVSELTEEFRAVVSAALFLNLISGITTETFELSLKDNAVQIKSGKSTYKLAMIYENDKLMELPVIKIENKTVSMGIENDILKSILSVNSKELAKAKNMANVTILQRMYYISEEGCLTSVVGACLNSFTLDKPIKLALNDRIVKLFKLFNSDVLFNFGYDAGPDNKLKAKVSFETENVYVAAFVNCDDIVLKQLASRYTNAKTFLNEKYSTKVVLDANALFSAISRLMLFSKNSLENVNMAFIPATITIVDDEFMIKDSLNNIESVVVENGSFVGDEYTFKLNLADLKSDLESCKNEHITFNCGNSKAVAIIKDNISYLIPEVN